MKKGWFRLEISLSRYSHFLPRQRVLEGDFLGMKMQSGCRLVAIERIAQDRGIQTFLMSTMHSQLVGSARLRIERQAKMGIVNTLQNLILRNGLLALFAIHHLAGTVQKICYQRERR